MPAADDENDHGLDTTITDDAPAGKSETETGQKRY